MKPAPFTPIPLAVVAIACGLIAVALTTTNGEAPPRTIGMDPRVESPSFPLSPSAVTVGETAGAGRFVDAARWVELERVAREEAEAAARAARTTTRASSGGGGGGCADGDLACIRRCESTDDYGAVSSNGVYRGGYQFDQQTWESVGGSGDPAAASPAEQDSRAQALYEQRGNQPWACG